MNAQKIKELASEYAGSTHEYRWTRENQDKATAALHTAIDALQAERDALHQTVTGLTGSLEKQGWENKALRQQLEAAQAEVKHLNLHLKATQSGRDAALARLSKIERQEPVAEMILVDMGIGDARQLRVNWLMDGYLDVGAKLYASAGASPVEPSLARVVEPVATGVKQLAAQLHDDQKWTVEEQQQFAVFLARFPSESSQGIISLGDAWKHGKACATPKATATLLSRATDLHEKAQMSWKEAEALALSEAGVTLSTIDELIGNSAYRGVDSLLTTPDEIRDFTRAILVHSSNIDALYATPQAAAQPPAPSDTAITYMTGYSDCKEWAGATNQALVGALTDATQSLETISMLAGRKTYGNPPLETFMETFSEVRGYAISRAGVGREAIAAAPTFIIYEK